MAIRITRIVRTFAKWLFIICLPFLLFTAVVAWIFNSQWLYEYGFNKYDVATTTGIESQQLSKAAAGLISYFNSTERDINLTVIKDSKPFVLFNEKEVIHLRDVKGLVQLDYRVLLGTGIFALCYVAGTLVLRRKGELVWAVTTGSGLTLVLMVLLGAGILFDFDALFTQFHLISFSNDFWLLNPNTDYLVMLFPQGFWYDVFSIAAGAIAGLAILLGVISSVFLLFIGKKNKTRANRIQK